MNGQDRIITVHNDTIECKILSISSTHINYEETIGNRVVGKFVPVSEVSEYHRNATKRDVQKPGRPKPFKDRSVPPYTSSSRHWQAGVRTGFSLLTASTAAAENEVANLGLPRNEVEDYYKKLKQGMHLVADIHYLHNDISELLNMGWGFKYRLSSFSSDMEVIIPVQSYVYSPFAISEKMYVNYWGLSYIMQHRLGQDSKFKLEYETSFGYVHYRDEARFGGNPAFSLNNSLATGNTIGADLGFSFAWSPLNRLSVNAGVNYFVAVIKYLTVSNRDGSNTVELDKANYEHLSHLNCLIGVQFYF
jgi:hypothetical protein